MKIKSVSYNKCELLCVLDLTVVAANRKYFHRPVFFFGDNPSSCTCVWKKYTTGMFFWISCALLKTGAGVAGKVSVLFSVHRDSERKSSSSEADSNEIDRHCLLTWNRLNLTELQVWIDYVCWGVVVWEWLYMKSQMKLCLAQQQAQHQGQQGARPANEFGHQKERGGFVWTVMSFNSATHLGYMFSYRAYSVHVTPSHADIKHFRRSPPLHHSTHHLSLPEFISHVSGLFC